MRPLVIALCAGSDLVGQGLRTLEVCVDSLTADYLDPIMAPVIDELMTALFNHLRPAPYSHFHSYTTMRILGKLGGRNRKFMIVAQALAFRQFSDDITSFDLKLVGLKKDRAFPAEINIDLAIGKLMEIPKGVAAKKSDSYYKKQSLHMIKAQLKLRLGADNLPDDFARLVQLQAQDLLTGKSSADFSLLEGADKERSTLKKEGQDLMTKKLIKAIIFAVSLPEFSAEATSILTNVCRYITILEVGRSLIEKKKKTQLFDIKAREGLLTIDSKVLADAIVESLASDMPQVREAAEAAIQEIYDSTTIIFGSDAEIFKLSFFSYLSSIFCHGCYEEEWFTKAGGSMGINLLLTKINLGDTWINDRQIEFVRSLLYITKDMPPDLPAKTQTRAQETLEVLVYRCTKNASKDNLKPPPPPQSGQPQQRPSKIFQLCRMLDNELSHMNKHVRETTKRSLEIIAKELGAEIYEVLEPTKDRSLTLIYNQPLRALPFLVHIGFIDAVTYYMGLKNDFVPFDDHLNRLLMESLALADAPDESLAGKPPEQKNSENIVNLRVACIKMLTTAMGFEDFQKGPQNATRTKIISVFFECLYSESKQTIEAANDALKVVLSQTTKLPKDLLQNGLRPVLANLQDPRRLSVHGLDGLARLSQPLTTYFIVKIGSQLLDHIKVLADPNILQRISFTLIEQNE
jgi:transformation/transcription domain-associated protein